MSTAEQYAGIEIGGPSTSEAPPDDAVERDRWIDWRLRRIRQELEAIGRNNALANAEIERYTKWREDANAGHVRTIEWLEEQVRLAAMGYEFPGKAKSRKLPSGAFGFRAAGGRTVINDMAAAVEFAREKGIPVKVTETVGVTEMKEYIESTGDVPEFVEQEPKVDKFFVRMEG
jgi:sugar phosphate isomerase/epimerase